MASGLDREAEAQPAVAVHHIFHPTDLSTASEVAFAHALRIAVACRATLSVLHADARGATSPWLGLPSVHHTLIRWGLLPPGSVRDDVARLGITVRKTETHGTPPAEAILGELDEHPADLLILATHRLGDRDRLRPRVAQPVARKARTMTLFVPEGAPGFVSLDSGRISLSRALLPVDFEPEPQTALDALDSLAASLGAGTIDLGVVHVGGRSGGFPDLHLSRPSAWKLDAIRRDGDPVEEVLRLARERSADLVVLATAGRHGVLDALRGSTSERIVRGAPCPVLAVPLHLA